MKEPKFFRCKSIIMKADLSSTVYKSINQAKKASFKIQKENGGLGCGILKVVEKF